ncbi:MAG: ABC transporter permease [Acidobacteriota bacterium]
MMETIWKDIRYGIRSLLKYPGFTSIALITLALGIGANTAIFSLVNAVLLKPLPFPDADRLVLVWEDLSAIGFPQGDAAPGNYADWKKHQSVFDDMGALAPRSFSLTGEGDPERIMAHAVTANLFPLMGVAPATGRNFLAEEDQPGGGKVVLLSHGLWQRRYASQAGIVGRDILLDGEKYTVAGVMPEGFQFLANTVGLWIPIALSPQQLADHENHFLTVVARLKPGVTRAQADADIQAISQRIVRDHPDDAEGLKSVIVPLHEQIVGNVSRPLLMLVVAAGLVLLIACANIASLQLSRAAGRGKEIAVRAALGASRGRIVRQLLAESIVLACAGGVLGLLVALWSFALLKQLIPPGMTASTTLKIDLPLLGFAFAISIITGILFGLAPALQASKIDLNEALKQGGLRAGSGARGNKLRGAFVVAEVALAFVLLIGAGLMIQTVYHLLEQYSLFQPERLLTLRTILPDSKFRNVTEYQANEHAKRVAFNDQVLERVNALPGVVSAGYTTSVPLSWKGGSNGVLIESRQTETGRKPSAIHRQISSGYFQTMGMGLLEGRYLAESDRQGSMPVAIVNESLAREWRSESPIGKRFKLGVPNAPWITVVGIVRDVRQVGMDVPPNPEMYLPYGQISTHPWYGPRDLVIRTTGDPNDIVAAVRREIHAVDPDQPVSNVATMEELLIKETGSRRLGMILLAVFSALALLLASLGIYGVLSFFVAQQTRDIGVRLALGAQLRDVLGLVLKKGMGWALLGVAVGLIAAFGLSRLMTSLLFGVSAKDPITFAAIALILMSVSLLACYLPARRATKVDPLVALRYE